MTPRASRLTRLAAALAVAALLVLPGVSPIVGRLDPASVYAQDDGVVAGRRDLEVESAEDEDADEPLTDELRTVSPSQINRVTLTPSARRQITARRESGYYCLDFVDREGFDGLRVGFERADDTTCQVNAVYQTLLSFEEKLGDLRSSFKQGTLRLSSATLSWSEKRIVTPEMKGASCVAFVSRPSEDWVGHDKPSRMPNTHFAGPTRKNSWDVKELVGEWLNDPVAGNRGVVIRGLDDSLDHSDGTTCTSAITAPQIKLVYTTPLVTAPNPGSAPKPAQPTKPDLVVTRVSGPAEVANGVSAVYDVVLANEGTAARATAQMTINAVEGLQPMGMVETPSGFTCEDHPFGGFSCSGSLGGVADAVQTRVAIFKIQVRATQLGRGVVYGLANHDRTLDEMTVDNNIKMLNVTVK